MNLLRSLFAVSRARSILAYLQGMPRLSLMKLLAIRLSPQAGKSLVMRGSLRSGLLVTIFEDALCQF